MQRAVLALAFAALACGAPQTAPEGVDEPLPAISLSTLEGQPWRSSDHAGKPQVIDVWASWCEPCRKGFPRLARIADRHPEVVFTAVSIDESADAVHAFTAQTPIPFPIVLDTEQTLLEAPWSVTHVPTILVVDAGGVVRYRVKEPGDDDYDRVEAELARLSR